MPQWCKPFRQSLWGQGGLGFKNQDGLALHTVSQWVFWEVFRALQAHSVHHAEPSSGCVVIYVCVFVFQTLLWMGASKYGYGILISLVLILSSEPLREKGLGKWVLEWEKEEMRLLPLVLGRPCLGLVPVTHVLLRITKLQSVETIASFLSNYLYAIE